MAEKRVAVIIPALHRPDLTAQCLRHLSSQTLPAGQMTVTVVENDAGSGKSLPADEAKKILACDFRQILLDENLGTTGSINRGLAGCEADYVLLLNNDVELEPAFLAKLLAALEREPAAGFATGKLRSAKERRWLDGAGDALLMGGGAFRLGHLDEDAGQFDQPRAVLAGCGAATLYRRSVLEEAGRLDEDFFAYLDDVDLALRIQWLGHHGLYVPEAVGYHIGSATLGDPLHPRIVRWLTRNQLLLLAKNYPAGLLVRLAPRIAWFQVLWFLFSLRHGSSLAWLRGQFEALLLLPRIIGKRRRIFWGSKLTNQQWLDLLRRSESQVYEWHSTRSGRRSRLLNWYFGLFGRP